MKSGYKLSLVAAATAMCLQGVATSAMALDAGDFLVRGRIINVNPNDDSDNINPLTNATVSVDDATTLELDFTYMFTANFGLELILATTNHDINGEDSIASLGKVADTGVLPPTLTAQYHFMPSSNIRPYVGAGVNYTIFYDEETKNSLTTALGATDTELSLDDSYGLAGQVGVDIDISGGWFFNADVKYIQISTEAEIKSKGPGAAQLDKFDVDINPWVFGIGVGTTF